MLHYNFTNKSKENKGRNYVRTVFENRSEERMFSLPSSKEDITNLITETKEKAKNAES